MVLPKRESYDCGIPHAAHAPCAHVQDIVLQSKVAAYKEKSQWRLCTTCRLRKLQSSCLLGFMRLIGYAHVLVLKRSTCCVLLPKSWPKCQLGGTMHVKTYRTRCNTVLHSLTQHLLSISTPPFLAILSAFEQTRACRIASPSRLHPA